MSGTFDELRGRFLELEGEMLKVVSGMRLALDQAEEENRRLRDEAQAANVVVYTEEEAAALLRMSRDTLARLRDSEDLPHFRAGMLVRYTNRDLAEITELLKPARGRKRPRAVA